MARLVDHSLKDYLDDLASLAPAPGGGSAAAYVGALGAGLITMAALYSIGRGKDKAVDGKLRAIKRRSEALRRKLLAAVDTDAAAYQAVVDSRKGTPAQKQRALKKAVAVPRQVAEWCYEAVDLTPYLVENGNKYLISDVEVAAELLLAAFRSAMINVRINQPGGGA